MADISSKEKMAQNEAYFRSLNRKVQEGFDEIASISSQDGTVAEAVDTSMILSFICECSDENCTERIQLSLKDYNAIHERNDRFTVAVGHDVDLVESVVQKTRDYWVVQKYTQPPVQVERLYSTEIENT